MAMRGTQKVSRGNIRSLADLNILSWSIDHHRAVSCSCKVQLIDLFQVTILLHHKTSNAEKQGIYRETLQEDLAGFVRTTPKLSSRL